MSSDSVATWSAVRDHLRWRLLQFRYRMNRGDLTRSVNGVTATFGVRSFREFLRVTDYQGENDIIRVLLANTCSEDVFWDIGANIGTHSCYVGQIASSVVAVEPHPENADRARENLGKNGVAGEVLELALGTTTGTVSLRVPESDERRAGTGTFTTQNDPELIDVAEVSVTRGDDLVENGDLPLPNIVKIDVEGAEIDVLSGFTDGISNAHTVLVEVHPEVVAPDDVTDLLESLGFEIASVEHRDGEIHVVAKNEENRETQRSP